MCLLTTLTLILNLNQPSGRVLCEAIMTSVYGTTSAVDNGPRVISFA